MVKRLLRSGDFFQFFKMMGATISVVWADIMILTKFTEKNPLAKACRICTEFMEMVHIICKLREQNFHFWGDRILTTLHKGPIA